MKVPGTVGGHAAGASDWDDPDLLTLEEAGRRLQEEIAAAESELASLVLGTARESLLATRLQALQAALRRNDQGPSPLVRP